MGLGQHQHAWLGEDGTALLAVILTGFPWVDIFAFLVFYGGLLTINSEIFDAAAVDGANVVRRFLSIDLPGLRPQIMLVMFFAFIGSIQGFEGIYVLTGGGPGTATSVPALEMFLKISKTAQLRVGYRICADGCYWRVSVPVPADSIPDGTGIDYCMRLCWICQ